MHGIMRKSHGAIRRHVIMCNVIIQSGFVGAMADVNLRCLWQQLF